MNKKLSTTALGLILALSVSAAVEAKTLVFCSEGSPEGFNPQFYTAGTTFDASSRQIYNRLVQFTTGTTNIEPALAESWEVSDDGLEYTFHLRQRSDERRVEKECVRTCRSRWPQSH